MSDSLLLLCTHSAREQSHTGLFIELLIEHPTINLAVDSAVHPETDFILYFILRCCYTPGFKCLFGTAGVFRSLSTDASYHDRQRYYDENYRTAYAHGFANDVELDAGIARERRSEDAAVPIATSTDRTDNNHTPWPTGTVYVTGRHHGSPAFLNTVLLIGEDNNNVQPIIIVSISLSCHSAIVCQNNISVWEM